jgi:hypothetical protein
MSLVGEVKRRMYPLPRTLPTAQARSSWAIIGTKRAGNRRVLSRRSLSASFRIEMAGETITFFVDSDRSSGSIIMGEQS